MSLALHLAERGRLPDGALRLAFRRHLRRRIRAIELETEAERQSLLEEWVERMDASPRLPEVALSPPGGSAAAAAVLHVALGARFKSSCSFWPAGTADLDAAESAMLARTCENARLEDGMDLLDLGCGWGSLALWLAESYPASRVVAVAASPLEREFVARRAAELGLDRLEIAPSGLTDFAAAADFDRVFAIETFARTRNYRALLDRIRGWLRPGGRLLVQSACHRRWPYAVDDKRTGEWPAARLFAAGLVPSDDLLGRFADGLEVERHYSFSGEHYERTAEAWLRRLTARRAEISGRGAASERRATLRLYRRWRLVFLACAEQFGCHRGQEWWVNHDLLRRGGSS